ncbi:MAG: hypothetical protein NZ941_07570 [Candidatus Caldarchaeum sp.]|nr:hypothetical protein [Candidatus Caldarchaeum sp.]
MGGQTTAVQVTGFTESYKKPIFIIDGKQASPTTHCSLAIAEVTDGEALILVPESLAVMLADDVEELVEMAMNSEKLCEKFKTKLREQVDTNFKVRIVPSAGLFVSRKNFEARYSTDFDLIRASFFLIFLELLAEGRNIYFDVSSGLNVYPASGLRALYDAATYQMLENFNHLLNNVEAVSRPRIVFYGQVNTDGEVVRPRAEEIEMRVLKEFPLSVEEIERISSSVFQLNIQNPNQINRIVSQGFRSFNCLVLNIPLPLYDEKTINLIDEDVVLACEREVSQALTSSIDRKSVSRNGSQVLVERKLGLNAGFMIRLLYALALTRSLMRMIKELRGFVTEDGVPLKAIREFFLNRVYRDGGFRGWFWQNRFLLENELGTIEEAAEKLQPNQSMLLKDLLERRGSGDSRRNFFAHSGFLSEITNVTKDHVGKIYLSYKFSASEKKPSTIHDWLSLKKR